MPTTPNVKPFVPGHYEIRFQGRIGGDANALNRLFFAYTGTMGQTEATSIANNASTQWAAFIMSMLTGNFSLETITVTDLSSATAVSAEIDAAHNGSNTGTRTAAGTSMLLVGSINRRYRGGKPRWYQAGLPAENLASPQQWTPGAVTNWFNNFASFINAMHTFSTGAVTTSGNRNISYVAGHTWTTITLPSGQVNFRRDPVYRETALPDPITAWNSQIVVASQRRRNRSG